MPNTISLHRRAAGAVVAGLLVMTACGSDDPDDAAPAASADDDPVEQPSDDPEPATTVESGAEVETTDVPDPVESEPASEEFQGDASATRTVEHALGTSEVPVDPERIVVLDSIATLDSAVALGAAGQVVGRINLSGGDDPSWLDIDVDAIPLLGTWPNLSIEEILSVDPDLLIGYQNAVEFLGPADERVPTVAVAATAGVTNPRWQDVLIGVGDALGEAAAAESFIADYDRLVDETVAGLPEGFAGRDVLVLLGQAGMTGFAMGPSATPAEVFERVGLSVSPSLEGQGDFVQLSDEVVPDLAADVVLMLDFDAGVTDWNAVLADSPAYAANPAIAAGVVVVDGSLWLNAGPLGQLVLLDEIVEVLAP